ncbi:alpha/beta hydrolase [Bacillus cereus]|uniref:alpha/beta hydrolase n=1 Tax=Bacillus cereus TaxID=1396 RepID=UPI0036720862
MEGLAPVLILTPGVDPLRDGAEAFGRRLRDEGTKATVKRYDGVPHGFLNMLGILPEADLALAEIVEFLRAEIGRPA